MALTSFWRVLGGAGLAMLTTGCVTSTGEPMFPAVLGPVAARAPAPETATAPTPLSPWESADPSGWTFVTQSPAALTVASADVRFTHRIGDDVRLDETFALELVPLDRADGGGAAVILAQLAAADIPRARLVQAYLSGRAVEAGRSAYAVALGFAAAEDDDLAAVCAGEGALFAWMTLETDGDLVPVETELDAALGLSDQFEAARAEVCALGDADDPDAEDADTAADAPGAD